ncbi:hypothetical protein D3C87_377300 [compost metagenome]
MMKLFLSASSLLLCCLAFSLSASANVPESLTQETVETYTVVEAANYCRTLQAPCELLAAGGQCGADVLTGWRLPSADELGWFLGLSPSQNYLWTRTVHSPELNSFVIFSLLDGSWGWGNYEYKANVRCVR